MTSNEKHVLFLSGIGHFVAHFYMLMFPSLALWIHKDLNLSLAETLGLGFWMYLTYGVMAVPMGALADRWSHRALLLTMLFGIGLGCLISGLADSPGTLTFGLTVIGFFASIYHPVGTSLISHTCTNRGSALGINGIAGNFGISMGPVLAGVAGHFIGWHWTFFLYGAITFASGLVLLPVKIDETPLARTGMAGHENEGEGFVSYFLVLLVCMTLLGLNYRATVVAMPAHFDQHIDSLTRFVTFGGRIGSHEVGITLLVSVMYLFGTLGQLLGGALADRYDLRKGYVLFHVCSLPFLIGVAMLNELSLLVVSIGYVAFNLGMQPIENSLVARMTPARFRSMAYGLKFVTALGIGAFSVKGVEWIIENGETATVFHYQAGILILLIMICLGLIYASRRHAWHNA
jgi:FSR family fosmidomycin resistance protein-like MFS transporter